MNRYAITINNWQQADLVNLLDLPYDYLVVGFEQSTQGVPHLQCYLETCKNFIYLMKLLPRAHVERARKSREVNIKYCKKSGRFLEDAGHSLAVARTITKERSDP